MNLKHCWIKEPYTYKYAFSTIPFTESSCTGKIIYDLRNQVSGYSWGRAEWVFGDASNVPFLDLSYSYMLN